VNDHTVFLKIETVRQPITVVYQAAARRIQLFPLQPLRLRANYTVELAPGVSTAEGHPLGQKVLWQFTVSSLIGPDPTGPSGGAVYESPYCALTWSASSGLEADVSCEVYAGTDSTAIATRRVAPIGVTRKAYYLPAVPWKQATRYFWAVSATNSRTGFRLVGRTASFSTVPFSSRIDSMVVAASEWAYLHWDAAIPENRFLACRPESLTSGPLNVCEMRWPLKNIPQPLRLAGAVLTMRMSPIGDNSPSIWGARSTWGTCALNYPGPPFADDDAKLADGVRVGATNVLRYESGLFTAHLEASARFSGFSGYVLRSSGDQTYGSPNSLNGAIRPTLRLYYYWTIAAPATGARVQP
jgi:hypothetical protein